MIYLPAGRGRREADYNFSDALRFLSRALFFKHPIRTTLTAVCLLQVFIFVSSYSRLQASAFYPTFEETAEDVLLLSHRELPTPGEASLIPPLRSTIEGSIEEDPEEAEASEESEGEEVTTGDDPELDEEPEDIQPVDAVTEGDDRLDSPEGEDEQLDYVEKVRRLNAYKDGFVLQRYRKYIEIKRMLFKLANATTEGERVSPKVTVEVIGKSIQERDIYCLRVEGHESVPNKTRGLLILAGVHAREWSSIAAVIEAAARLIKAYGTTPWIRETLKHASLHFIPVLNPDGFVFSWTNHKRKDYIMLRDGSHADPRGGNRFRPLAPKSRQWRDNRRDNMQGSYGVDLNRNFGSKGFTWGFGKRNKNFIDYQGEAAYSEPEALALHLYAQRRQDLNGFVDFHCCAKDVRAPEAAAHTMYDETVLKEITRVAKAMSKAISEIHGSIHPFKDLRDVKGGRGVTSSWAYWDMGWRNSYIIEIGGGFITRASWLKNKTDEVLTIIGLAFVEIATTEAPLNTRALSKHSTGAPVAAWNRFLKEQGFLTADVLDFGKQTQKATMVFQKVNKVKPTGSVDPRTLAIAKEKGFRFTPPALSAPAPKGVLRKELERLNEF